MVGLFYIYEIETNVVFFEHESLPDNYDTMEQTGDVIINGKVACSGVKFGTTADWFYSADGSNINEKDDIMAGVASNDVDRAEYIEKLKDISGITFPELDTYIDDNITTMATAKVYLKKISRVVLAITKLIDKELL